MKHLFAFKLGEMVLIKGSDIEHCRVIGCTADKDSNCYTLRLPDANPTTVMECELEGGEGIKQRKDSRLGFGEIAWLKNTFSYNVDSRSGESRSGGDHFARVISVTFWLGGKIQYHARLYNGIIQKFDDDELEGDPDYDQVSGYPPEADSDE